MSSTLDVSSLFQMDAQMLTSLRTPFETLEITVLVYSTADDSVSEEFSLSDMYSFQTIHDIQHRIYDLSGRKSEYHPSFQFLGIPSVKANAYTQSEMYLPITHLWKVGKSHIYLKNPWKRAAAPRPDDKFVTASGEGKAVEFLTRRELLIEDIVEEIYSQRSLVEPPVSTEEPIILHLYLYQPISASIPGAKPASEATWRGKVIPYFPFLGREQEGGDIDTKEADLYTERLSARLEAIGLLNELLEAAPLSPLTFAGLRHLRLQWPYSTKKESIESMFYETEVTSVLPYLRLFPAGETPISKVHVTGIVPRPSLDEPQILLQWAQEKSPFQEHDFMIGKLFLREGLGQAIPPLYGTLRVFEGGSADFILQPPRQMRKLDPRTDLSLLTDKLTEQITHFSLSMDNVQITDMSFYLSLRLQRDAPKLTRADLMKKLPVFRAFFQETPPLSGDAPLLSLRFKAVTNFSTEDRIFSFCTQVSRRKVLQGEAMTYKLVKLVQEEFQLTEPDAKRRVAAWFDRAGEIAVTNTETLEYGAQYNPGTDIAIYAQHPFYSFHIYRADSLLTLRRVITLLTMFIGLSKEDLQIDTAVAQSLLQDEAEKKEEAAAANGSAVTPLPAMPAVSSAADDVEEEDELDDEMLGMSESQLALLRNAAGEEVDEGEGEGGGESLKDVLEGDKPAPAKDAGAAPVRAAAPPPPPPRPAARGAAAAANSNSEGEGEGEGDGGDEEDDEEMTDPAKLKDEPAATYFIKRLKYYDKQLFDYSKKHPSAKKYVRQCASNLIRQPTVMNYEEYTSMKETYAADPVVFIEFGPGRTEYPEVPAGYEEITVLEYGSNLLQPNYYICSKYWCRKDEIIVLEKDFISDRDRNVPPRPKPRNTCPFCRGSLIDQTQRDTTLKGQTVLERIPHPRQKGKNKRFLSIGFLKKQNPDGLFLPCCYIPKKVTKPIPKTHPAFAPFEESQRKQLEAAVPEELLEGDADAEVGAGAEGDEEGVSGEENVAAGTAPAAVSSIPEFELKVTDYFGKLQRLHRSYIVSSEKLPLEVTDEPQVGLLPAVLDRYFEQNPDAIVQRAFTTMGLKESSRGFLRLGVENRQRYAADSFLSCLAPFLLKNNTAQVKSRILEVVTPEVFLNLNYGNFLLEFYDPSVPIVDDDDNPSQEAIDKVLKTWASTALRVNFSSSNRQAIQRAFQSYANFRAKLFDIETNKEYRQYAELLATPGLLTPRGLVFIVLDLTKKGELIVRCPAYGVRPDLSTKADIGILFHHQESGIWEPILYTENRAATVKFSESHEAILIFQRDQEAAWPPILRRRVGEFFYNCRGPGRAIYTSESRVNPAALLPLSRAIKQSQIYPEGILRDAYNHIAALTFPIAPGSKSLVVLPVADDGTLEGRKFNIHLDWDDVKVAAADEVVKFYEENFQQILAFYPGYKFLVTLFSKETQRPVAIQMLNGLKIPVAPAKKEGFALPGLRKEKVYITKPEWQLNKELVYESQIPETVVKQAESREIEEIYQHLRITFANWVSSEEAGPQARRDIQAIIERKDLALFERRKRLDILIGSTVLSWMDSAIPSPARKSASILRVDCRTRPEGECNNRCVWAAEEGRCALHTPAKTTLGDVEDVDVPTLLLHRLIEELLRFAELRRQLLENDVNRIIHLHDAVHIKDQYIIPENIPLWTEFLRFKWLQEKTEEPRFYEELSAPPSATGPAAAPLGVMAQRPLPPALAAALGAMPTPLTLFTPKPKEGASPLSAFKYIFDLTDSDIPAESRVFTEKQIARIAQKTRSAIVQIDFNSEPGAAPTVLARSILQSGNPKPSVFILVSMAESISIVVVDASQPEPIPFDSIPESVQAILKSAKVILIKS